MGGEPIDPDLVRMALDERAADLLRQVKDLPSRCAPALGLHEMVTCRCDRADDADQ